MLTVYINVPEPCDTNRGPELGQFIKTSLSLSPVKAILPVLGQPLHILDGAAESIVVRSLKLAWKACSRQTLLQLLQRIIWHCNLERLDIRHDEEYCLSEGVRGAVLMCPRLLYLRYLCASMSERICNAELQRRMDTITDKVYNAAKSPAVRA